MSPAAGIRSAAETMEIEMTSTETDARVKEYLDTVTAEDKAELTSILKAWQADGVARPLLPTDVDLNGDGKVDSFGLDENGELTIVFSVPLEKTVFRSDGDDIDEDVLIARADEDEKAVS